MGVNLEMESAKEFDSFQSNNRSAHIQEAAFQQKTYYHDALILDCDEIPDDNVKQSVTYGMPSPRKIPFWAFPAKMNV
jgi:hypothetical protein